VKVLRDITLEEINKFFGLVVNTNGYSYEFTKDLVFMEKVEKLWMKVHQKACVLASKSISFGMVRGLACERLGKPMNWTMYAEWTNSEQQRQKAKAKKIDLLSSDEKFDYGPYTPKHTLGQAV
jgi:hypothetical protein